MEPYTDLSEDPTIRRLEAAVTEARAFFGIDPLWRTPVQAKMRAGAQIDVRHGYLLAPIEVGLDYYQNHPGEIRCDMAHEVAHLVAHEVLKVQQGMPPEWQYASEDARGGMLTAAIETMTTRLELLFMRERPE